MNKTLLLSLPIAALIASCSSDDNEEKNSGNEIKFVTNVPSMSVKGSEITTSNLASFKVSAYNGTDIWAGIDEEAPIQSSGTWAFNPAKYMPSSGSLDFWAYSPTDLIVADKTARGFILEYAPSTTASEQKDIVAAYASSSTSPVSLTFSHLLSKIKFNVQSAAINGYSISIKGVRLGWINRGKGKLTYASGNANWSDASGNTKASYEIGGSSATAIDVTSAPTDFSSFTDNAFYVLPQQLTAWEASSSTTQNAYISFLCQVKQYGVQQFPTTGEYDWGAAIGINTKWEPGYEYTYNITFFTGGTGGCGYPDPSVYPTTSDQPIVPAGSASSEIKFNVSVSAWTQKTETPSYTN